MPRRREEVLISEDPGIAAAVRPGLRLGPFSLRPEHARILLGVVNIVVFVFAAKLIGAAKEMAIAARYGTGSAVDAYLLIFRIYDLPVTVWASALNVTLIPLFFRIEKSPEEGSRFRRELLGFSIALGLLLGIAAVLATPFALARAAVGLTPEARDMAIAMAGPLAAIIPLGIVMGVVFARLMAAERHVITLLEGVPAFFILLSVLVLPGAKPEWLVWGTVVGFVANLVLLLVVQRGAVGLDSPRLGFKAASWTEFGRFCMMVAIADFVLSGTSVVDQLMVAHLAPGAIASLGYANRIVSLVLGLGATAIARATLPTLSRLHSDGGDGARQVAMRWAGIFFGLGVLAVIVGWLAAPLMVRLLFERGAFTAKDTAAVADVLRFGLLQVPFYFCSIIFAQLRAAHGRYAQFIWINAINVAVKLAANVLLIDWLGVRGAMVGTALMCASSMFISLWLVRRR